MKTIELNTTLHNDDEHHRAAVRQYFVSHPDESLVTTSSTFDQITWLRFGQEIWAGDMAINGDFMFRSLLDEVCIAI